MTTKTGKVVDFRNKELLTKMPDKTTVPLLWACHFYDGQIRHPFGKEYQYIYSFNPSLLLKNNNYLFIKRFSSKEEPKRLQTAIYMSEFSAEYLAAENHLNYIDCAGLNLHTMWGLYAILNSSLWDSYIRLFNGSTQVNAGDINGLPLPSVEIIEKIGQSFLKNKSQLDKIVLEAIQ